MILKTDKDISEIQNLIDVGEIFGIYKLKSMAGERYREEIFRPYELSMGSNKFTHRCTTPLSAEMVVSNIAGKNLQSTGHGIIARETLSHIAFPDDIEKLTLRLMRNSIKSL